MTGLEKILAGIASESQDAVNKITADADAKVSAAMGKAAAEADAVCSQISAEKDTQLREIAQRADSAAQLNRRKKLLEAKQELIAETLQKALDEAEALPEKTYFDTLLHMAAAAAHADAGEISLCARDLARLPADFESRLNAALTAPAKLTVAKKAADIRSGFVLLYSGIEENCSFEAVFAARHDEMQDKVCEILFS